MVATPDIDDVDGVMKLPTALREATPETEEDPSRSLDETPLIVATPLIDDVG
jgi:hypothetical protein